MLVRSDKELPHSYTDTKRQLIHEELGAAPSAFVSLILNWWKLAEACDAATTLVLHLLSAFDGIVDDGSGNDSIWRIEHIRNTKRGRRFLDCYRERQPE